MVFFSLFLISLGLFTSGWVKFFFSPQVESEEVTLTSGSPGTPYSRSMEVLAQLQAAEKQLAAEINEEAEAGKGSANSSRVGTPAHAGVMSLRLCNWLLLIRDI